MSPLLTIYVLQNFLKELYNLQFTYAFLLIIKIAFGKDSKSLELKIIFNPKFLTQYQILTHMKGILHSTT